MEKPTTVSTSFRLPSTTITQVEELARLLKESKTDVITRAVQRLYDERESVIQQDFEIRIGQAKGKV